MSVPRKVTVECIGTNNGRRVLVVAQPVDRPKTTISLTLEEAYHVMDDLYHALPTRDYPKETK